MGYIADNVLYCDDMGWVDVSFQCLVTGIKWERNLSCCPKLRSARENSATEAMIHFVPWERKTSSYICSASMIIVILFYTNYRHFIGRTSLTMMIILTCRWSWIARSIFGGISKTMRWVQSLLIYLEYGSLGWSLTTCRLGTPKNQLSLELCSFKFACGWVWWCKFNVFYMSYLKVSCQHSIK